MTIPLGYCVGQLRPNGPQMLHGRSPHPVGGTGSDDNGDWLVQAVPHLLHGGPHDGATDPPLVAALAGEHGWTLL